MLPRSIQEHREACHAAPFHPTQEAALTSWLRPTATAGAVSSVADVLSSGNPATQGTPANQPTAAAASNGVPMLSFDGTNDFLTVPIHSGNNGSPRWAWAGWIRPAIVTGVHTIYASHTLSGASASRLFIQQNATDVFVNIFHSAFSVRRLTAPGVLALNTLLFLTVEFDGTQSLEPDECIITANAAKITGNFTNDAGLPDDMPDALLQPTGTNAIGDLRTSSPLQPWNGLIGAQYILQGGTSHTGGGVISAARRLQFMNFERPA